MSSGRVYLVGAGPGDPGLLTRRGAELLQRADVIVYDRLANPELLRLASPNCEVVYGGKRTEAHALSQAELNRLLIDRARSGKTVVRLKGGDPYLFGRGGEEAEMLADAGVPFEVVPGVSSISAVPNYAGVPLTHRGVCSAVTVVTGHEDPSKDDVSVDWKAVAGAPGTKVLLMGVLRLREIAGELMRHGMPAETPALVTRWGTTAKQKSVEGTLATIADRVEEAGLKPPAVAVFGEVVELRGKLNWFERRSLFGQRIVVTRAREQASRLSDRLREAGAEVVEIPMIRMEPPQDKESLKDAILSLHEYDWIVFTSPNGVKWFFDWFFKGFDDLRDFGGMRVAAVGPATAAKLRELHLKVDVMPDEYTAEKVGDALAACQSIENLRVLLMRAESANPELPKKLEAMGAIVDDVACYRNVAEAEDRTGAGRELLEKGCDWITFTSGSTVDRFHERYDLPKLLRAFPGIRTASIGPETSAALRRLNLEPTVEASEHTLEGLAAAVARARGAS